MIGFADSDTGAFLQLELSTPAVELAELAGSLADHLDSTNLCERIENDEEGAITSVAEAARVHIVLVGRRIRSRVLSPLALDVKNVLIDRAANLCTEDGLTGVSSAARVHIVLVGARSQAGDLLEETTSDRQPCAPSRRPAGRRRLRPASRPAAGEVGACSAHGRRRTANDLRLAHRHRSCRRLGKRNLDDLRRDRRRCASADDAWSESFSLQIGDDLSRSEAFSILRDRARSLE